MNSLYENSSYLAPIDYMVSTYIREYDITKANINILLYKGIINQKQFDYYFSLPREQRQYQIGMLQKDRSIAQALSDGFKEMMKLFFEHNNIDQHEVLTIKKDAVYIINKIPNVTQFGNVEFVFKNIYTSFYKLNNKFNKLEMYYYNSRVNNKEVLDIKGISDKVLPLHYGGFFDFLLTVFNSAEIDQIDEVIAIIQGYYHQYINFELPIRHYRSFDNASVYKVKNFSSYANFTAEHLPEHNKMILDISCNASIIMELYKIFSTIYYQTKNKG